MIWHHANPRREQGQKHRSTYVLSICQEKPFACKANCDWSSSMPSSRNVVVYMEKWNVLFCSMENTTHNYCPVLSQNYRSVVPSTFSWLHYCLNSGKEVRLFCSMMLMIQFLDIAIVNASFDIEWSHALSLFLSRHVHLHPSSLHRHVPTEKSVALLFVIEILHHH